MILLSSVEKERNSLGQQGGFIFLERTTSTFPTWTMSTSSNRILIPRSKSHLSPSNLNTRPWNSLQIATRSSKQHSNDQCFVSCIPEPSSIYIVRQFSAGTR